MNGRATMWGVFKAYVVYLPYIATGGTCLNRFDYKEYIYLIPDQRMCCIFYRYMPMIKSHPTAFGKLCTSLLNVIGCMVS